MYLVYNVKLSKDSPRCPLSVGCGLLDLTRAQGIDLVELLLNFLVVPFLRTHLDYRRAMVA